ncbi:MAG: hypothetical protein LBT45_03440 [Rickettsiales bacterium]|jgi:hypothetical protein|nr:hypothetical protein [Rickettsiales bacterium]
MKRLLLVLILFFPFARIAAADDEVFKISEDAYKSMTERMSGHIDKFGASIRDNFGTDGQLVADFVPVEARVGGFFISALSSVARAVYKIFVPFLNALVLALFAFWIFMESWQMMKGDNNYWNLAERVVKKGALIVVWLWILNNDPAELFMWLMSPIITVGNGMADLIFSGTAKIVGAKLPDTCAAIHDWLDAGSSLLIPGPEAADLLCMPVRAAGFFYTNVAAGLGWMAQGLGRNGLMFLMGLVFVLLFMYNIWKFAISALGVVVDLFFVLMFLPFTAVKECFANKDMKYNGIFAPVFNEFVGFVKDAGIAEQAMKFVRAMIYFVVLSLVSAICMVLMSGAEGDFMSILICGCITAYLLGKTGALAEKLGGKIDDEIGSQIAGVVQGVGKNVLKWGENAAKIIAKGKSKS